MSLNQKLPGTESTPFNITAALKYSWDRDPIMAAIYPP